MNRPPTGPTRTNAKARMKLRVRIDCLRFRLSAWTAVLLPKLITKRRFRSVCAKAENGFITHENCFVARRCTNQVSANDAMISNSGIDCRGVSWPIGTMIVRPAVIQ